MDAAFPDRAIQTTERPDATPFQELSATSIARPLALGEINVKVGKASVRSNFELKGIVDGTAELVVNAESSIARFATAIWVAASTLTKKPAFAAMAAALGVGVVSEQSSAALMPDGSNGAAYMTLANQYAGETLWFHANTPSGAGFYGSAVRLNSEWALTAAHNVVGPLGTNTFDSIGNGTDYMTAPGLTRSVASVIVDPNYDGSFNTPDVALIHFASAMPGKDLTIGSSPTEGDVLTAVGFGNFGTPSTGIIPADGNSRGWEAPLVDGNPSNVSDVYYISTAFSPHTGLSLNGKALGGDSGGPLFDSSGDLLGINVGQDGGTDPLGDTVSLRLFQSDVADWINQTATVPEPSSITAVGGVVAGILLRRRRNS